VLIRAYGAYGSCLSREFKPERLSLVADGWTVVLAHVRGGGELGAEWHSQGRQLNKTASFRDLCLVVEALQEGGVTVPAMTTAVSTSAGGMLLAGCVNQIPDRFGAVTLKVPFVDVVGAMSDPTLPLTLHEIDEWGDPADREVFDTMMQYSPYDNIQPSRYPPMLVTASLKDIRVPFWQPAKFVAKLRATALEGSGPILLQTSFDSGHFGDGGGLTTYVDEAAKELAFLQHFVQQ